MGNKKTIIGIIILLILIIGIVVFTFIIMIPLFALTSTIDKIMDILSEEEIDVYKRGRNTSIHSVSKNVDVIEYKKSTGFEALIGYLYVKKDMNRLDFLVSECIKCFD